MGALVDCNISISLETILQHQLHIIVSEYEENIYMQVIQKQFATTEDLLTDFYYVLMDINERDQLFIMKAFFTGLITTILHRQIHKHQVDANKLQIAYQTIYQLQSFTHATEFTFFIPAFVKRIEKQLDSIECLDFQNKYVNDALKLIHSHLCKRYLSLQWLADQLAISTTYLSSLFRIYIGQTVHQYITSRRMNEVAYDIRFSNMTMGAIRKKYGYPNSSQFIQLFKKVKGVTPLQYQKSVYY